jgi:DNA-directed RNA polymerase subunit N
MKPIRCFTCGSLLGDKYEIFSERIKNNEEPGTVLDDMDIKRYCCRRMILSNVDIIDQTLPYYEFLSQRKAEFETDAV